uniref:BED-type domain-containing protein n=1 Tax=Steinernema glaseri TaxID=37863 RepID=A0A1I8AHE5_9BILA
MPLPRSDVYKHFEAVGDQYSCIYCKLLLSKQKDASTSHLKRHVEKHKKTGTLVEEHSREDPPPAKKTKFFGNDVKEQMEESILRFFTAFNVPFQAAESKEFRDMLGKGGFNSVNNIPNRKRLASEVLPRVALRVKSELQQALTGKSMSISADEYSSGGRRFVSVTCTFFTNDFQIHSKRLDVFSLTDNRATADILSREIRSRLEVNGICREQLIGFTRDGGSNFVRTAQLLKIQDVHCFLHVLHLLVSRALCVPEVESVTNRIRTLAAAFKNSSLATAKLKKITDGRTLRIANSTRWNSTYSMLTSFSELRSGLNDFMSDPECQRLAAAQSVLEALKIDTSEVEYLTQILAFFQMLTTMAESRTSFVSLVPYLIFQLKSYLSRLANSRSTSSMSTSFVASLQRGFSERQKEYENNPLIYLASFLDPRFVFRPELMNPSEWKAAENLIITKGNELTTIVNRDPVVADDEAPDSSSSSANFEDYFTPLSDANNNSEAARSPIELEVETYRSESRLQVPTAKYNNSDEVLQFWKKRRIVLPLLSTLAMKYLTVLSSSAEPERVFSGLSHLLANPKRGSLSNPTIERLLTVRHDVACKRMDSQQRVGDDVTTRESEPESEDEEAIGIIVAGSDSDGEE